MPDAFSPFLPDVCLSRRLGNPAFCIPFHKGHLDLRPAPAEYDCQEERNPAFDHIGICYRLAGHQTSAGQREDIAQGNGKEYMQQHRIHGIDAEVGKKISDIRYFADIPAEIQKRRHSSHNTQHRAKPDRH